MTEALIRERIEAAVKALNAKDIDGLMSLYAPDIVSFDIAPHFGALRYVGADNKRRAWEAAFASFLAAFSSKVALVTCQRLPSSSRSMWSTRCTSFDKA